MDDLHQLQQLNINNLAYDTSYFAKIIKGMRVKETSDYVIVNSGLPTFNFNIITLLRPIKKGIQEKLLTEITSFNEKKLPINIWCYEHYQETINRLTSIGLQEYDTTYVAMVANLNSIKQTTLLQDRLLIRKVSTPDDLHEFSNILMTLYDDPLEKESIQSYYVQVAESLELMNSGTDLYIGLLNGKVVTTGALTYKDNTVGMYHIATLENYRGQGLGTEMIQYLLNEATKSEATYCTLQSSPEGKNIYETFGFSRVGTLKVFENQHVIQSQK